MLDYREEILDHYKNPRNFGELAGVTHEARGTNSSCGDMIEFQLKIEKGKIIKVAWRGVGCALSTAAASMLSEKILGKSVLGIKKWDEKKMIEMLGEVNMGRMKCVTLPLIALQSAIKK
jgi:nitrogen fixation protein NifU and related proteins